MAKKNELEEEINRLKSEIVALQDEITKLKSGVPDDSSAKVAELLAEIEKLRSVEGSAIVEQKPCEKCPALEAKVALLESKLAANGASDFVVIADKKFRVLTVESPKDFIDMFQKRFVDDESQVAIVKKL